MKSCNMYHTSMTPNGRQIMPLVRYQISGTRYTTRTPEQRETSGDPLPKINLSIIFIAAAVLLNNETYHLLHPAPAPLLTPQPSHRDLAPQHGPLINRLRKYQRTKKKHTYKKPQQHIITVPPRNSKQPVHYLAPLTD